MLPILNLPHAMIHVREREQHTGLGLLWQEGGGGRQRGLQQLGSALRLTIPSPPRV